MPGSNDALSGLLDMASAAPTKTPRPSVSSAQPEKKPKKATFKLAPGNDALLGLAQVSGGGLPVDPHLGPVGVQGPPSSLFDAPPDPTAKARAFHKDAMTSLGLKYDPAQDPLTRFIPKQSTIAKKSSEKAIEALLQMRDGQQPITNPPKATGQGVLQKAYQPAMVIQDLQKAPFDLLLYRTALVQKGNKTEIPMVGPTGEYTGKTIKLDDAAKIVAQVFGYDSSDFKKFKDPKSEEFRFVTAYANALSLHQDSPQYARELAGTANIKQSPFNDYLVGGLPGLVSNLTGGGSPANAMIQQQLRNPEMFRALSEDNSTGLAGDMRTYGHAFEQASNFVGTARGMAGDPRAEHELSPWEKTGTHIGNFLAYLGAGNLGAGVSSALEGAVGREAGGLLGTALRSGLRSPEGLGGRILGTGANIAAPQVPITFSRAADISQRDHVAYSEGLKQATGEFADSLIRGFDLTKYFDPNLDFGDKVGLATQALGTLLMVADGASTVKDFRNRIEAKKVFGIETGDLSHEAANKLYKIAKGINLLPKADRENVIQSVRDILSADNPAEHAAAVARGVESNLKLTESKRVVFDTNTKSVVRDYTPGEVLQPHEVIGTEGGRYNPETNTIELGDLGELGHEAGHAIEQKAELDPTKLDALLEKHGIDAGDLSSFVKRDAYKRALKGYLDDGRSQVEAKRLATAQADYYAGTAGNRPELVRYLLGAYLENPKALGSGLLSQVKAVFSGESSVQKFARLLRERGVDAYGLHTTEFGRYKANLIDPAMKTAFDPKSLQPEPPASPHTVEFKGKTYSLTEDQSAAWDTLDRHYEQAAKKLYPTKQDKQVAVMQAGRLRASRKANLLAQAESERSKAPHVPEGGRPPEPQRSIMIEGEGGKEVAPSFYSNLEKTLKEKLLGAKVRSEADTVIPGKVEPAKTIRNPKTGEVIKEIPERVTPEVRRAGKSAADQILAVVKSGQVTQDEIKWSGLEHYLNENQHEIHVDKLIEYLEENRITPEEMRLRDDREGGPDNAIGQAAEGFTGDWNDYGRETYDDLHNEAVREVETDYEYGQEEGWRNAAYEYLVNSAHEEAQSSWDRFADEIKDDSQEEYRFADPDAGAVARSHYDYPTTSRQLPAIERLVDGEWEPVDYEDIRDEFPNLDEFMSAFDVIDNGPSDYALDNEIDSYRQDDEGLDEHEKEERVNDWMERNMHRMLPRVEESGEWVSPDGEHSEWIEDGEHPPYGWFPKTEDDVTGDPGLEDGSLMPELSDGSPAALPARAEPVLPLPDPDGSTDYAGYTNVFGKAKQYTELLLRLPRPAAKGRLETGEDGRDYYVSEQSSASIYRAPHFTGGNGDNLLAHIRFDTRYANGKKVLFVHEIQSDWHQTGREKGYASIEEINKATDAYNAAKTEFVHTDRVAKEAFRQKFREELTANADALTPTMDQIVTDAVEVYKKRVEARQVPELTAIEHDHLRRAIEREFDEAYAHGLRNSNLQRLLGEAEARRFSERLRERMRIDTGESIITPSDFAMNEAFDFMRVGLEPATWPEVSRKVFGEFKAEADELNELATVKAEAEREYNKIANAVPAAPFSKSYHALAMRRVIREAAEQGYDQVAWTPGWTQTERWSSTLQDRMDKLELIPTQITDAEGAPYDMENPARVMINGYKEGQSVVNKEVPLDSLKDYVGNSMAEQYAAHLKKSNKPLVIEGRDLSVGGNQGFTGSYGAFMDGKWQGIYPAWADGYVKQFGSEVKTIDIRGEKSYGEIPSPGFDITPEMRQAALYEGQPLYQGSVKIEGGAEGEPAPEKPQGPRVSPWTKLLAHIRGANPSLRPKQPPEGPQGPGEAQSDPYQTFPAKETGTERKVEPQHQGDPMLGDVQRNSDAISNGKANGVQFAGKTYRSWEEAKQQGDVLAMRDDLVKVLGDKAAKGLGMTDVERSAAFTRSKDLEKALAKVQGEIQEAVAAGRDTDDLERLSRSILGEYQTLAGAIVDMGSQNGRSLAAHRMFAQAFADSSEAMIARHRRASGGKPVPDSVREFYRGVADDIAKLKAQDEAGWNRAFSDAESTLKQAGDKIGNRKFTLKDLENC